jgi:alkylation response protein AidB-like acyl-CoA dehydrogenase
MKLLKYSHERKAFGNFSITKQRSFKLAMYVKVTAAKLLVMKAACERCRMDIAHSGAMAKLYASKLH